jgi:hypothetical protein
MNGFVESRSGKFLLVILAGLIAFSLFGTVLTSPVKSLGTPAASVGTSLSAYEPGIIDTTIVKNSNTSYEMWFSHLKGVGSLSSMLTDLRGIITDNLISAIIARNTTDLLTELSNVDAAALYSFLVNLQPVIGYATSTDGLSWTVVNDNVLAGGPGGAFDFAGTPYVIKTGSTYQMWYALYS